MSAHSVKVVYTLAAQSVKVSQCKGCCKSSVGGSNHSAASSRQ